MKINIKRLLQFFDDPEERGHASAIIGLIGEDLCAAAFVHYWNSNKKQKAKVLQNRVTTGRQIGIRGYWLDRWIDVSSALYQSEIKNWAATAIGGRRLGVDADTKTTIETANRNWERQLLVEFSGPTYPNKVTKVLLPMRRPTEYSAKTHIEPLLIYWMPISNSNGIRPFFTVPVSNFGNRAIYTEFKKLHIFSASLYFREILKNKKWLNLELPNVTKRMEILNKIL